MDVVGCNGAVYLHMEVYFLRSQSENYRTTSIVVHCITTTKTILLSETYPVGAWPHSKTRLLRQIHWAQDEFSTNWRSYCCNQFYALKFSSHWFYLQLRAYLLCCVAHQDKATINYWCQVFNLESARTMFLHFS